MIYGLYFRFYKILHIEWISCLLARMAYLFYLGKFQLARCRTKKQKVTLDSSEAQRIVAGAHPDPKGMPAYERTKADADVDLSIIIPVYNHANLIENTIRAVLEQKTDYKYEVILVDDGSADGATDLVYSFEKDERVRAFFQENQGIAGARNTGIRNASGRYIMFVDCDDLVSAEIVDVLLKKAFTEDADIAMCGHDLVRERSGNMPYVLPNIYPGKSLYGLNGRAASLDLAGFPWAKVYRRDLFDQVRFFPSYWYEDSIIQFLLFTQSKKTVYVQKSCYGYKWYEDNFTHTQDKSKNTKSLDRYWLLVRMLEKYKELGLPMDDLFYIMLLRHVSVYYYPQISRLDEKVIEAAFVLACDILAANRPENQGKLPYMLRITEKAMLDKDINLWKLASCYQ